MVTLEELEKFAKAKVNKKSDAHLGAVEGYIDPYLFGDDEPRDYYGFPLPPNRQLTTGEHK